MDMAHLKLLWKPASNAALAALNAEEEPLLSPHLAHKLSSCFNCHLFQKVLAEMLGTFFLLFSVSGIAMVNKLGDEPMSLVEQAVATCLSIMLIISAIGHISGAHINPAVTISLAASGLFPWCHVPVYVTSQFLGASFGTWIAKTMYNIEVGVALTKPSGSNMQAFGMEFLISFHLMFLVAAVASDSESVSQTRELNALCIGGGVALNMVLGGPISGASMNPARSLGPAIIDNNFEGIWIYLIAPPIGGCLGAMVYKFLRNYQTREYQSLSFSTGGETFMPPPPPSYL